MKTPVEIKAPIIVEGEALGWHLRERMDQAGIPSVRELYRRFCQLRFNEAAAEKEPVKFSQFLKVIKAPPERINLRTLLGLAIVLDCAIGDLVTKQSVADPRKKQAPNVVRHAPTPKTRAS